MNTTTAKISPSFLLKGLDPISVINKYQSGFFSSITAGKALTIELSKKNAGPTLAPVYGTSNSESVFSFKDRHNSNIVIATSNHQNYETFRRNGGHLQCGGRCDFCKEDFEHTVIGYPIAFQENVVLTNADMDVNSAVYNIIYVFWVEGTFCSFECALGYLNLIRSPSIHQSDLTLKDSEMYLKLMYKLMYPQNGILRPAQDPKLLKEVSNNNNTSMVSIHHGSLSREEWSDPKHTYMRTDRVALFPVKVEYLRNFFSQPSFIVNTSTDSSY